MFQHVLHMFFPSAGCISVVLQMDGMKFSYSDMKTKSSLHVLVVEWVRVKNSFWSYILWAQ